MDITKLKSKEPDRPEVINSLQKFIRRSAPEFILRKEIEQLEELAERGWQFNHPRATNMAADANRKKAQDNPLRQWILEAWNSWKPSHPNGSQNEFKSWFDRQHPNYPIIKVDGESNPDGDIYKLKMDEKTAVKWGTIRKNWLK